MNIICRIQTLLSYDWRITLHHVYREGNCCADFLATYALAKDVGLHILDEPPEGVCGFLNEDAAGVERPRVGGGIS
ncbi:hypothetical protein K1719_019958 [Acacia pycnantha]|nr:hypothetical protein K1719_019958 [Acacia pycnantha]